MHDIVVRRERMVWFSNHDVSTIPDRLSTLPCMILFTSLTGRPIWFMLILEACSRPIVFPFQNLIPSLLPLANGVPVWPQIYRCGWWLPLLLFIRSWPQPHAHSIRKFLSLQRLHEYILRMLANPDMVLYVWEISCSISLSFKDCIHRFS